MILSKLQIDDIILKNPNKALIDKAKDVNKTLRMHLYGENLGAALLTIEGFEKDTLRTLRVKYAESNRALFARIGRPMDKIYSAKGGAVDYNLPENQEKLAKWYYNNVLEEYTIRTWLENFWTPHFKDDPNGIIFMEINSPLEIIALKAQGLPYVYPTYKSISVIYDYLPKGSKLEYVAFKVSNKDKAANGFKPEDQIFRIVDDAMDYWIKRDGGEAVTILEEQSFPNLFMKVPAMLNSDLPDASTDIAGVMLSPFYELMEMANKYLVKGSIKMTHDFMHGFPKYWEYADSCVPCSGTGYQGAEQCKECKGTGKRLMTKVSDAKLLSYPQDKDTPIVAPNVAGYVSPDKTYWEISTVDLSDLENAMTFTMWGATSKLQVSGPQGASSDGTTPKTATEVMDDIKPQSDRLYPMSASAEKREKFILDSIIKIQISQNYMGSSVGYGKRYMIESADALKDKYEDAKKNKLPDELLDNLYLQYLESEHSADQYKLEVEKKKLRVKPFFHKDASEIEASMFVTDVDKCAVRYFTVWEKENLNGAMWIMFSEEVLRGLLNAYATAKQGALPKPEPKPIAA